MPRRSKEKGVTKMAQLSELEERIRVQEDREQIRMLKAKYWRCLDRKLWDELAEVFDDDFVGDGPHGHFEGKTAMVKFLKDALGSEAVRTAHGGHNPEIEITSETTARAIWPLTDYVSFGSKRKFVGYGHYEDEYVKADGQWKMKSSRLSRIVEEWTIPEP